jgi:hypothetical protein
MNSSKEDRQRIFTALLSLTCHAETRCVDETFYLRNIKTGQYMFVSRKVPLAIFHERAKLLGKKALATDERRMAKEILGRCRKLEANSVKWGDWWIGPWARTLKKIR